MSYQNSDGPSYQTVDSSPIEILTPQDAVQNINATGEQNIRVNR